MASNLEGLISCYKIYLCVSITDEPLTGNRIFAKKEKGEYMRFVSLVGTQMFAVLNSFLAAKSPLNLTEVTLLATPHTIPMAEKIRDSLQSYADHIDIIPISRTLLKDDMDKLPVQEIFHNILKENTGDIAFNLAGGMNFMVAACALEDIRTRCWLLYPEQHYVFATKVNDDYSTEVCKFDLPASMDVLNIQRVPHTFPDSSDPALKRDYRMLENLCWKGNLLPLPAALNPIQIHDVCFHLFWNTGNHITFFKVYFPNKQDGKTSKDFTEEIRKLISLALSRDGFGDLYDRRIGLLTDNPMIFERVQSESGGKIEVFLNDSRHPDSYKKLFQNLNGFFKGKQSSSVSPITISETTGFEIITDTALAVVVGQDISNTLTAIFTHRPGHALLLYTPQDYQIAAHIQAICTYKKHLPVNKITCYPVDITGIDILNISRPPESKLEVNISPGTKGQATFLALWASRYDAVVCSNDTDGVQKFIQDPQKSGQKQQAPPPLACLLFSGHRIQSSGEDFRELAREKKSDYQSILQFIRTLLVRQKPLDYFPNRLIILPNTKLEIRKNQQRRLTFYGKKPKIINWSTANGKWFEGLIGLVMSECGASDVQIRMRTDYQPKTREHLINRHQLQNDGEDLFMTDIDVVARFDSDYYVISCKVPFDAELLDANTNQIAAMSKLFGRFALPMFCSLRYDGQPDNSHNGVYVFGPRTFTNNKDMKELLLLAKNVKKTNVAR